MTAAIIIPEAGTVVLRADGSVSIVDRNRERITLSPPIVAAILALSVTVKNPAGDTA